MNMSTRAAVFVTIALTSRALTAQDFRVESKLFVNGAKEPLIEQLTLFQGNLVYDFTLQGPVPKEVTMLDTQGARVVLLDVDSKRKTEVGTTGLLDFCAHIKALGTREENDELFSPNFKVTAQAEQRVMELIGHRITYRVSGIEPREPSTVQRYREFADWYSRLNALRAGNLPPFCRLELNRLLAEQGWLPEQIERNLDTGLGPKQQVRTQHDILWTLSNTDRRRIQDAAGYQSSFREVSLQEYLDADKVAQAP